MNTKNVLMIGLAVVLIVLAGLIAQGKNAFGDDALTTSLPNTAAAV
jgi:hypothetical protein